MVRIQKRIRVLFSIAVLFLSACEQDALVEPPAFEKKPAIMCLMTPQSNVVEASMAFTKPYYGLQTDEVFYISDAQLVLTELSSGLKDTFFNYEPGMYRLVLKNVVLKALETYQLKVRLADGSEYIATSKVPPKPSKEKFEIASVIMGNPYEDIKDGGWGGGYTINPFAVQFLYELPEKDFYVSPQLEGIAQNEIGEEIPIRISFTEAILPSEGTNRVAFNTQSEFYSGFGIEGPFHIDTFFGAIYTMDQSYRDYYRMQDLQFADNPFSEPVLFTNNFSNGAIGVFGSYDFIQGGFKYVK